MGGGLNFFWMGGQAFIGRTALSWNLPHTGQPWAELHIIVKNLVVNNVTGSLHLFDCNAGTRANVNDFQCNNIETIQLIILCTFFCHLQRKCQAPKFFLRNHQIELKLYFPRMRMLIFHPSNIDSSTL